MNYRASYSDIAQQNKNRSNMAIIRKAVKKEFKDTKKGLRKL